MASNGTQAGTGHSDLTTHQHQIRNLLNVCHRILMLSQTHGPTEYRSLRFNKDLRRLFNQISCDATRPDNVVPGHSIQTGRKLVKPLGVSTDEAMIENSSGQLLFGSQNCLTNSLQQCNVAVDSDLQEKISEWSSRTKKLCHLLWMFEPHHPNFRQRIDVDKLCSVPLGALERRQHTRMISSRVLTNDEDRPGLIEILESDRSLAYTNSFVECSTT